MSEQVNKRARVEEEVVRTSKVAGISAIVSTIRRIVENNPIAFSRFDSGLIEIIPVLVVYGCQSSGKSSIINRMVRDTTGLDLELFTSTGMATKTPTLIKFHVSETNEIKYIIRNHKTGESEIATIKKINEIMSDETVGVNELKDFQFEVEISGPECDNFTIVDLPGIFAESDNSIKQQDKDVIDEANRKFLTEHKCTVIHAINTTMDLDLDVSIKFISQLKTDRYIIAATHLDVADRVSGGAIPALRRLRTCYPTEKIYLTQACDGKGYIDEDIEIKSIKSICRDMPEFADFKISIGQLRRDIPDIIDELIGDVRQFLNPLLVQLRVGCEKQLKIIGYSKKSDIESIHEWTRLISEITSSVLMNDRSEFNKLADSAKNSLTVKVNGADMVKMATEVIERTQFARGKQLRAFVSIDGAFKSCIDDVKDMFTPILNDFITHTKRTIIGIINAIITQLKEKSPMCVLATDVLSVEWMKIFEQLFEVFTADIISDINVRFANPETSKNINKKYLYALSALESYAASCRGENPSIENFKQFVKRAMITTKTIDHSDDATMVARYVIEFIHEHNEKFPIDIYSKICDIADGMRAGFNGPFITEITSRRSELVVEPEHTQVSRAKYIEVISLINKII